VAYEPIKSRPTEQAAKGCHRMFGGSGSYFRTGWGPGKTRRLRVVSNSSVKLAGRKQRMWKPPSWPVTVLRQLLLYQTTALPYLFGTSSTACRQSDGRFKRTYELTSSIVLRGTSFHHLVELEFPPIAFDPARLSCCFFPLPPELSAVDPEAVHDHGQPARRDDRLFHPAMPGDLHCPGLKPGPFCRAHQ
jgi:hypothetical protein